MPKSPRYQLTLSIFFASEQELEAAIALLYSWGTNQAGTGKKYGFIKKTRVSGDLFFISSEPIGSDSSSLTLDLEFKACVMILQTKFNCLD